MTYGLIKMISTICRVQTKTDKFWFLIFILYPTCIFETEYPTYKGQTKRGSKASSLRTKYKENTFT